MKGSSCYCSKVLWYSNGWTNNKWSREGRIWLSSFSRHHWANHDLEVWLCLEILSGYERIAKFQNLHGSKLKNIITLGPSKSGGGGVSGNVFVYIIIWNNKYVLMWFSSSYSWNVNCNLKAFSYEQYTSDVISWSK